LYVEVICNEKLKNENIKKIVSMEMTEESMSTFKAENFINDRNRNDESKKKKRNVRMVAAEGRKRQKVIKYLSKGRSIKDNGEQ
jgi:ribosomal protein S8